MGQRREGCRQPCSGLVSRAKGWSRYWDRPALTERVAVEVADMARRSFFELNTVETAMTTEKFWWDPQDQQQPTVISVIIYLRLSQLNSNELSARLYDNHSSLR